jgi:hypothetical protein
MLDSTLVHASSSPPHLHSSVQTRLFCLHEHLLAHFVDLILVASQLHLTSCRMQSGAGGFIDSSGIKLPSSSFQPSLRGLGSIGCWVMSWAQIAACTWARRMCSIHAPGVGGRFSTPWLFFSCLNRYHLNSLASKISIFFGQNRELLSLGPRHHRWAATLLFDDSLECPWSVQHFYFGPRESSCFGQLACSNGVRYDWACQR